jgi:DNA polymerase III subunit delta'
VSRKRVWGHDAQVQGFARVVQKGRLAHAYLFVGLPGIGKKLFALELAKSLLCENPPSDRFEACDHCPSCLLIDAGNHPDLHLVTRPEESLELPIEVIRELCRNFSLKTARGKGKVAILDDADDLSEQSANCFLKTLEEPPSGSVLILIGSSADRQLATIRSRCQTVSFAPLSLDLVEKLLSSQGIEDSALLKRIVRLSDGSPGQAQDLAEADLWAFRTNLLKYFASHSFDSWGLARMWLQFTEEAGKDAAVQRRRTARVLKFLIMLFRDAIAVNYGGGPNSLDPEELSTAKGLAERIDPDRLMLLIERCLEADEQVDRRVQIVLVIEALLDALGQKMRA